jgi:glycosyltransferase involved in cell wall biosynthesis
MPSPDGKRICLVTAEFHGLFKNGGIGTANTGLALTFADAGHDVTVAYVDAGLVDYDARLASAADTIADWGKRGVKLEFVPRLAALRPGHEDHVAASYAVLQHLRGRGFDIVFFNECGGQGYHSLLAKKAGLFPDAPRMVVVAHGASAWVHELNAQLYWSLHPISVDYLERRSVELADDLVSPSAYLVDWMRGKNWRLPASTRVIQNALPVEPPAARAAPAPVGEVVFFGRLEARKGVELFLDAYTRLCARRDMSGYKVTFLGKFSRIEGVHSGVHVLERTRKWPVAPTLIVERGQADALKYLSRPGVLAVMPSRAENSPCVVGECLIAGVPFVATDSGGTAELVAPNDRARALSAGDPQALADRIAAALDEGAPVLELAVSQATTRAQWLALLDEPAAPARETPAAAPVSLCLALRAPLAAEAWAPLLAQAFAEIVVVASDDGVALPEDPRIRRIVEPSLGRADARNVAAAQARGPWLMFAHERDVVLKADALARFLSVATRLSADVVTSPALEFAHGGAPREDWDGNIAALPQGANAPLAAYENCLGEGCFLIDRRRLLSVGGFKRDASDSLLDRLLLTEAMLAGAVLEVAPEPLFWRRERLEGLFAFDETAADQRRLLQAFGPYKAEVIAPALESLAAANNRAQDRLGAALAALPVAARELALKLSRMPQREGGEQNRPFLEYALLRGRMREALAFARELGDPELLTLARAAAAAAAETAALDALRAPAAAETHRVSLMRFVAERARAVAGLAAEDLRNAGEAGLAYPLRGGAAAIKSAHVCPPSARRLHAKVEAQPKTRVALVACDRFALLRLEGEALTGAQRFAWTGWRAPGALSLDLDPPFAETADILLLADGAGTVAWSGLEAEVGLFDFDSGSHLAAEAGVTPLPRRLLASADLLTPAPEFPGRYFIAGSPTLHHPLAGRPALARLGHALFQGARGVRAAFGLEHEQSHPVEFAFWARRSDRPARDLQGLADSPAFSGWHVVRSAYRKHDAEIVFPEPLDAPHDLYLATRVVEFPDNSYCHAVWHDIAVIESSPARN